MHYYPDYRTLGLRKVVFKNTSALIIGRGLSMLFSLASSILVVRYLGSERLGGYASIYAYVSLFSFLTTLGMEQILIRQSSRFKDKFGQIIGTGSILSCQLSVVACVLALSSSVVLGYAKGFRLIFFMAVIDALLLSPLRLSGIVFQIYMKQWYTVYISVARQFLWIIIIVVFIFFKFGLAWIILGRLLCSFFEALATFVFARRLIPFGWHFNYSAAKSILKGSWPIALSALGGAIYHRIDQVMLHMITGDKSLGYYAAGVSIAELFSIFAIAITSTMLPILSDIAADKERFQHYFKICFRYLGFILFGICATVTVGSPLIIRLLYGGKYLESAKVLSVLIWSEAGVFFGLMICTALIARGQEKLIPISTTLGAIINVLLNLLWIPKWGIIGAAWATVISYNLVGFILFFLFSSTRDLASIGARVSILPFLTALSLVVAASFVKPDLISIISVFVLYLGGMFIFKVLNKNDLRAITELLFKGVKASPI